MTRKTPDSPPDSGPALSREAETPRGGFMARPGMKTPPRHAVVVRVGDAPESDDIPLARSSVLPPPPSEAAPESASEKITLRAVPKPSTPPPPPVEPVEPVEAAKRALREQATIASVLPAELARLRALESAPPPSDAPLVSSVRLESEAPRSRPGTSSRWPIVLAAAAGLVLGLVSVATRVHTQRPTTPAAAAAPEPAPVVASPQVGVPAIAAVAPSASSRVKPLAAPSASPAYERSLPPSRPASPGTKRSIF